MRYSVRRTAGSPSGEDTHRSPFEGGATPPGSRGHHASSTLEPGQPTMTDDLEKTKTQISGVAHTALVVSNFEICKAFYVQVLGHLGFVMAFENDQCVYLFGGNTAIGIQRSESETAGRFDQQSTGLHHLCLRARSREVVDDLHRYLVSIGANVMQPPQEGPWAPGYYSVLFEDPVGIRLEVNHVPGRGLFETGVKFNPVGYE